MIYTATVVSQCGLQEARKLYCYNCTPKLVGFTMGYSAGPSILLFFQ